VSSKIEFRHNTMAVSSWLQSQPHILSKNFLGSDQGKVKTLDDFHTLLPQSTPLELRKLGYNRVQEYIDGGWEKFGTSALPFMIDKHKVNIYEHDLDTRGQLPTENLYDDNEVAEFILD
jgi:hypothetical protein